MQPGLQGCGLPARLGACRARREGCLMARARCYEPLYDIYPLTGATIEVFYADRAMETFGRVGAGWFWCSRQRGLCPVGLATGPFATGYAAYRHAMSAAMPISS